MPYDSNGNFTRVYSWEEDRQNNIDISSDRMDEEFDGIANALSSVLLRDGRCIAEGDLNMGSFQIKQLARGTTSKDAIVLEQLTETDADLRQLVKDTVKKETGSGKNPIFINSDGITEASSVTIGNTSVPVYLNAGNLEQATNVISTSAINKSSNGYTKLSNGLLIQWGIYDSGSVQAGMRGTVTFPTPFSSADSYQVTLTADRGNADDVTSAMNCELRTHGTTSFLLQVSRTSGTSSGCRYVRWLAIGY